MENLMAKQAAQRACDARHLKMPEQDFVGRGAAQATVAPMSEMDSQIADLEIAANRLESLLCEVAKRLGPVLAKQPENTTGGLGTPMPARRSYVGHRLQQVEMKINNLSSGAAEILDRLVV